MARELDGETWLTTGEAAPLLGETQKSVARAIQRRYPRLDGVRIRETVGGHYLLAETDVRALAKRLGHQLDPDPEGGAS